MFYARYVGYYLSAYTRFFRLYRQYQGILRRVEQDHSAYTDIAMTPVQKKELDTLELYNATAAAKAAVSKVQRREAARASAAG